MTVSVRKRGIATKVIFTSFVALFDSKAKMRAGGVPFVGMGRQTWKT